MNLGPDSQITHPSEGPLLPHSVLTAMLLPALPLDTPASRPAINRLAAVPPAQDGVHISPWLPPIPPMASPAHTVIMPLCVTTMSWPFSGHRSTPSFFQIPSALYMRQFSMCRPKQKIIRLAILQGLVCKFGLKKYELRGKMMQIQESYSIVKTDFYLYFKYPISQTSQYSTPQEFS